MLRTVIILCLLLPRLALGQAFNCPAFVAALEDEAGVVDPWTGDTFYINPNSLAGGTGTSTNTSGADRAFHSANDFADAMKAAVGTGDLPRPTRVFACCGPDTDPVLQDNWDFKTTAVNFLRFIGDNSTGKFDPTKYHGDVTNSSFWYNDQLGHVQMWNVWAKITVTSSSGANYVGLRLATGNNLNKPVAHEFRRCGGHIVTNGTDNAVSFGNSDPGLGGGTCVLMNCVADGGFAGFNTDGSAWAAANLTNYNGTVVRSESGFDGLQGCINCVAAMNGVDYNSTGTSGHINNGASDATAGGTGALDNQLFFFVDTNNFDFHLHPDDLGARGLGITTPGGAGLFSDDIDGETRTVPWDIGADKGAFTTIPTFFADTGNGETAGAATSSVLTTPASVALNDIIVYGIMKVSTAAITPPASEGWTEATGSPWANAGEAGYNTHIFWKRSDGSEPATHTFTWSGSVFRYGHGVVIRGCTSSGSPFDQEPAHAAKTTDTDRLYPDIAITTAVGNTLILWMGNEWEQATSGTPPTTMVETEDAAGGNNPWEVAIRNKTSAGAFTATGGSYGGSATGVTSAFIMSLKP